MRIDDWEDRLLRRLDVVTDDRWTYAIRLSAVKAIQAMLGEGNPLRYLSADALMVQMRQGRDDLRAYLNRHGQWN